MNYFFILVCFILTGGGIQSAVVKHNFEVSYISGSPDGVLKHNILAINGQFPGPTIEATVGDTIEVTLINKIQDGQNVTIHWHGLQQRGTIFEDGTSMISQCPLPYGSFQVYRFQVTEPNTYWYHSHSGSQYTEGLIGALIVHNQRDHYKYDGELTLILQDWYHRSAHENEAWYLSAESGGLSPYPDSGLINGLGRYPCNLAQLQDRTCSIVHQRRQIFTVQQNATYRVRIINAAATSLFDFSIDDHILDTIEVDGVDVAKPVAANVATIAPGQRYSFLVQPKNVPSGISEDNNKFVIRSVIRKDLLQYNRTGYENINKFPEGLLNEATSIFHPVDMDLSAFPNRVVETFEQFSYHEVIPPPQYTRPDSNRLVHDDKEKVDNDDDYEVVYLDQMDLLPLDGIPAPDYFDEEYILSASIITDENGIRRESFNGTPFYLPEDKPLLFTLLEEGELPETAFPLSVSNGSVVQLVLNSIGTHPYHLHGHNFWVVGMGQTGDGNYDPSRHTLNVNAMKRDTIVPPSWAVIRFVADNPSVHTLHCHNDWHNLAGMALTIVEGADILMKEVKPTAEALRICQLHK